MDFKFWLRFFVILLFFFFLRGNSVRLNLTHTVLRPVLHNYVIPHHDATCWFWVDIVWNTDKKLLRFPDTRANICCWWWWETERSLFWFTALIRWYSNSIMLSDTVSNNVSLSVAKTSTFSRSDPDGCWGAATAASFTAAAWRHLLDKSKTFLELWVI